MADKKFDLVFNASLEVGQVKAAVASLTKSLEGAGAKIPQSMATNLNRMIQSLNTELNKLEGMTDIQLDPKNAKNVGKSYEKIFQTFQQIKAALGDIHRTAGIDPEKFFPSEIASNIAKAAQAVQKYKKAMEAGVKTDEHTKATKDIAEAEKKVKSLNDKLDEAARKRQSSSIVKDQLQETRKKLQAEKDQAEAEDKAAKEAQKTIQDRIKSQERLAQVEEEIAKKKKKQQEAVNKAAKANEVKNERESMKQAKGKGTDTKIYRDAVASYAESTAEVQKLQGEIDQLEAEYTQLSQTATVTADEIAAANERATKAATELTNAQKRLNKNQTDIDAADTKYTAATAEVKTLVPEVQKAEDVLNQLIQKKEQLEVSFEQSTFDELIQELEKLGIKLPDTERNMEGVERALESMASEARVKVVSALQGVEKAAENIEAPLKQAGQAANNFDQMAEGAKRAEQDMENLKNQVLDFFSITNTIQIFKNAIKDAFDTVKELDAAMTETAVVTDFSIGDMWDKLPEYSEQATKLGTSIKSLYEATTLYYQQGLDSNQAMGVGIETMKMARIANMDAAQATEAMTAALRGFNMEINEMSATRINDVYSELAAITAADTSQIATAMSKTASIAESANMEFETTAALLAQIIETTQEAPETAGTAMKTIIARFTEVKQLFSEGMLIGEDSEGEEININKIDAALKTVGISLKDFLTGAKGIDDIFLELASKWDTLDLATQRYIATTAAGSRQQSRFLAMMSNYDRTMELVNAATNSAGASQQQFDKTLESLEAKIQRLKNAWAEFTMGLANSDVIKWAVDLLTDILNIANKITGLAGNDGLGGIVTMFIRLATVITALKGGERILNGILKHFSDAGFKVFEGKNFDLISALFSPLKEKAGLLMEGRGMGQTWGEAFKYAGLEGKKFLGILSKFGPYIALFAALAAVIYKVVTSFQAAQKAAKIEDLNKTLGELSNEAEQANSKLVEMGSDQSNLKTLQDTLNDLTKGTDEWKQALVNTNQEVLSLIEKYPELSDFLSTGKHGQLVISSEGWDEVYARQQQLVLDLTNQKIATQAQITELQSGMEFDNFVIQSHEEGIQREIAEFELKVASWLDSNFTLFGWDTNLSWGDIVAAFNDAAYSTMQGPSILAPSTSYTQQNQEVEDQDGYVAVTEREKTGGLTEKEYTAFAAALVEEGITLSDGLTETEYLKAQKIYQSQGLDMDFFEPVISKALELGAAFDQLGNSTLSLQTQEEQTARTFLSNAINGVRDVGILDYSDAISNVIAETKKYDTDLTEKIETKEKELENKYQDNDILAQDYAKRFGKYYAGGKLYTDKTMQQEIPVVREGMIEALATADITIEVQQDAIKMANIMKDKNAEQKQTFDELFSIDGSEIKLAQINKYKNEEGIKYDQVATDLGFENLQDMATKFDVELQELINMLASNFESATNRINKQRRDLVKNMTRFTSDKNKKNFDVNADLLLKLEAKYKNLDIHSILLGVFEQLDKTGDEELSTAAYESLRDIMMKAEGAAEMQEALDFFNEIDFSNPIDAFDTINNEIKNGTGYSRELAVAMKEANSSFLSVSSQMSTLFNSADFEDIKEDLDDIIEKNGEISAADVFDLTKSYKSLDKVLKNNEITANGLAEILEQIADGTLKVNELTDTVLAAMSSFESLESIAAKTIKSLEDFDLGIDENLVGETATEWSEIIQENLKKGAVGNSQNFRILDYLFPNWDEGLEGDALIAEMKRLSKKLEGNGQNLRTMWSDMARDKDYRGQDQVFETATDDKFKDLDVRDTGKEIIFEGWEGKGLTSKDLVTWIADAYNVSNEMASMMLTDFKNYSSDLASELRDNDYAVGIEKAYESLRQFGDIKLIDQRELETIANLLGKDSGTILGDLQKFGQVTVSNFYDDDGNIKSFEEIQTFMNNLTTSGAQAGKKWSDEFLTTTSSGLQQLDMSKLEKELGKIGISGIDAQNIKEQAFNSLRDGLTKGAEAGRAEVTHILENGEPVTIEINADTTYEEYQQKVAAQIQQKENNALAQAIAEAISNTEANISISENSIITFKKQVESIFQEADTELDIKVSDSSMKTEKEKVDNIIKEERETPVTFEIQNPGVIDSYINTKYVPVYYEVKNPEVLNGNTPKEESETFAKGIKNASRNYNDSLVSEEGPELIQKADGAAYLSGMDGPEIVDIEKGDTVYTAEETEDIFKKHNHRILPRYATGYGSGTAYYGSGGKGPGSDKDDKWENSFDKLYNLVREIDEELRQRERIERRYEKLLESVDLTADKLYDNSVEQLKQLEKEKLLNQELRDLRRQQIYQYQMENAELTKYAKVVQNERGEDVLRIHWDQINQVEDPERGQEIEDYVSQLEEWMEDLNKVEDSLNDIEDRIEEIKEQGKDEYIDLENAIKDAIEFAYQEEIDKLSEINESINDTNTQLINAMSKQLGRIRQQRENERTERELEEKQRQLLYLSQDTSGANDMQILQLQKDIDEQQVDYTDTLIDQKIEELEQQNEEAALQREQQIKILQTQLDYLIQTGQIWDEVYSLIDEGLDYETGLIRGSRLEQMLKNAEGFQGMSKIQQMDWLKELQQQSAQAVTYMRMTNEKLDTSIELDRQNYFGKVTSEPKYNGNSSNGSSGGGGTYGGGGGFDNGGYDKDTIIKAQNFVGTTADGIWGANSQAAAAAKGFNSLADVIAEMNAPVYTWKVYTEGGSYITTYTGTERQAKKNFPEGSYTLQKGGVSSSGINNSSSSNSGNTGNNNSTEPAKKSNVQITYGNGKVVTYSLKSPGVENTISYWASQWGGIKKRYEYKTGGLADFTGPAWLDGTKSRPELVLNQKDTQNFIQLKDILASLMTGSRVSTENHGDITYDIDINVENIGNDYDIEQVANKIKSLINEDARYRNNNAVSLKR